MKSLLLITLLTSLFSFNSYAECVWSFNDNNCQSGMGDYRYSNGMRYYGNFLNGKAHGFGVLYNADGAIHRKGVFFDHKFQGDMETVTNNANELRQNLRVAISRNEPIFYETKDGTNKTSNKIKIKETYTFFKVSELGVCGSQYSSNKKYTHLVPGYETIIDLTGELAEFKLTDVTLSRPLWGNNPDYMHAVENRFTSSGTNPYYIEIIRRDGSAFDTRILEFYNNDAPYLRTNEDRYGLRIYGTSQSKLNTIIDAFKEASSACYLYELGQETKF